MNCFSIYQLWYLFLALLRIAQSNLWYGWLLWKHLFSADKSNSYPTQSKGRSWKPFWIGRAASWEGGGGEGSGQKLYWFPKWHLVVWGGVSPIQPPPFSEFTLNCFNIYHLFLALLHVAQSNLWYGRLLWIHKNNNKKRTKSGDFQKWSKSVCFQLRKATPITNPTKSKGRTWKPH